MSALRSCLHLPWSWRAPRPVATRTLNFRVSSPIACQDFRSKRERLTRRMEDQGAGETIPHNGIETHQRKLGFQMENANTELGFQMENPNTELGFQIQSPKLLTLVIIKKGEKVLLGLKKRGFGAGYFNGFGGKVEANETVDEAAVRELHEESGVLPLSMEKRGVLTFHFDDNPQPWEVHVYHVDDYAGEPCETEEMAPRWFSLADIPYDKMWQDDPIWYPEFLHGRCFKGDFYFHNTHTLVSHTLHTLQNLDAS